MIKILHLADTHLGYSAFRKITPEGINQREADIYHSFSQVIDYAIEHQIDLILHAGDLFDTVRPNNRAITTALQQMLRLSKHQIPMVIIAGNHEQPKLKETGHIFRIFDHIPHIHPVYHEHYETKTFTIKDTTLCIHCLPQMYTQDKFQEQLPLIKTQEDSDYNIFLAHGSIQGIKEFSMNEFNEMMLPRNYLSDIFDYVALGHYHLHTKVDTYTYYPGSTDTFSFSEANTPHGFIQLTLNNPIKQVDFIPLSTRPYITAPMIACYGKDTDEIMNDIIQTIQKINPVDKIFKITLRHILSEQYRNLDFRLIRELCQGCLHYEITPLIEDTDSKRIVTQGSIDSLTDEYTHYIKEKKIEHKEMILKKGLAYLNEISIKDEV